MFDQEYADKFWSFADMSGGIDSCWLCDRQALFVTEPDGRKRQWAVHRIAYVLTHGHLEPGLVVRHLCVNSSTHTYMCVNPRHLRKGTQQENMWDKAVRQMYVWEPGEIGGYEEVPDWIPPPFRKKGRV